MKLAGILLFYTVAVGILFSTLAGGVIWLIRPGPAVSQEARPAPIPPRIADSIERRKPFPVAQPTEERKPEPVRPVLREANVSLAPAPVYSTEIRQLRPPAPQTRARRGERALAREIPAVSASAPAATVSAGRSDSPY
jgi:hypothetical protein